MATFAPALASVCLIRERRHKHKEIRRRNMNKRIAAAAGFALLACTQVAFAQTAPYPSKTIRIIAP